MSTPLDRTQLDEVGIGRALGVAVNHWNQADGDDVREIIAAYLTEPAKWPTDETLDAAFGTYFERDRHHIENARERVREAFIEHDPIIQAAITLRDVIRHAVGPVGPSDAQAVQAVIDAVNEAGL